MTYGIVKEWTECGLECAAWYQAHNASSKLVRWEFTSLELANTYLVKHIHRGLFDDVTYSVRAIGGQYAT